jgi:RecA-family ATPase
MKIMELVKKVETINSTTAQVLIKNILVRQGVTVLYGPWGSHKTWLTMFLSCLWSRGEGVNIFTPKKPLRILTVQNELPDWMYVDRLKSMFKVTKPNRANLFINTHNLDIIPPKGNAVFTHEFIISAKRLSRIERSGFLFNDIEEIYKDGDDDQNKVKVTVSSHKLIHYEILCNNPDVIVIDSLKQYVDSPLDVKPAFQQLSKIAREHNVAFFVIHHEKPDERDKRNNMWGGANTDRLTYVLRCTPFNSEGVSGIRISFPKPQNVKQIESISLIHNDDHTFSFQDYKPKAKSDKNDKKTKKAAIIALLKEAKRKGKDKEQAREMIKQKINVDKGNLSRYIIEVYGA